MKTRLTILCISMCCMWGCKQFSFDVVQNDTFTSLPALQSFVLGKTGDYWLIFGGRTNGFHGFPADSLKTFPFKKANKFVYVYNTVTHAVDSMSVQLLPAALQEQYTSSNMENTQVDSMLYVCGGYGEINVGKPDSTWITHSIFSRVHVKHMIDAILKKDTAAFQKSVVYDRNPFIKATGGEMYKMDDKFYLAVGHNYIGAYSPNDNINPKQIYLDSVHVFTLNETDTSIAINRGSMSSISDHLPDSTTQFRRRDLLVVPAVQSDAKTIGLTIYGGVFTWSNAAGTNPNATNPFRYPIYIAGGTASGYQVDSSYTQPSNIYATSHVEMYDSKNNVMYTTAFGGIGDTSSPTDASFTKLILTIKRDYTGKQTTSRLNESIMPGYIGAESFFIPSASLAMYNSRYGIIDYQKLPSGKTLLGHIYGGIISEGKVWVNKSSTHPSNHVYDIYINK